MARSETAWKYWAGVSSLGAISLTLAIGWWLDRRATSVELNTMRSQIKDLSSPPSVEDLRSENDDLIRFIDESYTLLRSKGIHVQLDLAVDEDGRYRLRADSLELMDELAAKLRQLEENPNEAMRDE
jgi:hypothetical protein